MYRLEIVFSRIQSAIFVATIRWLTGNFKFIHDLRPIEKQVHKYQLRAYLYQARGLLGADPSGYSDPYARVVFGNRSAVTQTIKVLLQ
jgi:hypothetical protein